MIPHRQSTWDRKAKEWRQTGCLITESSFCATHFRSLWYPIKSLQCFSKEENGTQGWGDYYSGSQLFDGRVWISGQVHLIPIPDALLYTTWGKLRAPSGLGEQWYIIFCMYHCALQHFALDPSVCVSPLASQPNYELFKEQSLSPLLCTPAPALIIKPNIQ